MNDNVTTLVTAAVGVAGTVVVALVGMRQNKATAQAAIQQAREAAGGPVYESTTDRNAAAFQMHRWQLYGEVCDRFAEYSLNGDADANSMKKLQADLFKGVRKAQIVADAPLREQLNKLAASPDAFGIAEFNDLVRVMNEDARADR
jgi:hypothetical protein